MGVCDWVFPSLRRSFGSREEFADAAQNGGSLLGDPEAEARLYRACTGIDMSMSEMERPIADLNLSVRARKCMVRLGLNTIGELIRKTGDDLLECKNFGVTSLNEVRDKLTQLNLKLRGD